MLYILFSEATPIAMIETETRYALIARLSSALSSWFRSRAGRGVYSGRGKGTGERDQKRQSANDPPCASPHCTAQAALRSWFISGNVRIRLPVAAKIALSTAGAATAIVGSPTPPQKSPVGTTTTSTFGISSMRITL